MPLPKIQYPTFTIEIPSTKKKEMFRPFLVKEEKILLMAKSSGQDSDVLIAMKQIVNNCALDDKFDVDKLSLFDLEYCFIKIRSASVSNIISVSYRDYEDDKSYDFDIDLNDIKIIWPEKVDNKIKISDTSGFTMKYPTASLYEDEDFINSGQDSFFKLIARCVDIIYNGDEVFPASSSTPKEIEEYLENLDVNTFDAVRNFMTNQPSLYYKIEYKNSLGNTRVIELRNLTDFFTLR
jgi:T4 bacteriophage base plate protein